jgi:hypothetical protein
MCPFDLTRLIRATFEDRPHSTVEAAVDDRTTEASETLPVAKESRVYITPRLDGESAIPLAEQIVVAIYDREHRTRIHEGAKIVCGPSTQCVTQRYTLHSASQMRLKMETPIATHSQNQRGCSESTGRQSHQCAAECFAIHLARFLQCTDP